MMSGRRAGEVPVQVRLSGWRVGVDGSRKRARALLLGVSSSSSSPSPLLPNYRVSPRLFLRALRPPASVRVPSLRRAREGRLEAAPHPPRFPPPVSCVSRVLLRDMEHANREPAPCTRLFLALARSRPHPLAMARSRARRTVFALRFDDQRKNARSRLVRMGDPIRSRTVLAPGGVACCTDACALRAGAGDWTLMLCVPLLAGTLSPASHRPSNRPPSSCAWPHGRSVPNPNPALRQGAGEVRNAVREGTGRPHDGISSVRLGSANQRTPSGWGGRSRALRLAQGSTVAAVGAK